MTDFKGYDLSGSIEKSVRCRAPASASHPFDYGRDCTRSWSNTLGMRWRHWSPALPS